MLTYFKLILIFSSSDECVQSFFHCYQTLEHAGIILPPLNHNNELTQKEKSVSSFFSCSTNSNSLIQQQQQNRSCSPYIESSILDEISGGVNDAAARLAAMRKSNSFSKEDAFIKIISKVKVCFF